MENNVKHIDYCANSLLEFLDQEHIDLALKRQMESIDRDIRANIEEFLFVSNAEEILDKYGMFMFDPTSIMCQNISDREELYLNRIFVFGGSRLVQISSAVQLYVKNYHQKRLIAVEIGND